MLVLVVLAPVAQRSVRPAHNRLIRVRVATGALYLYFQKRELGEEYKYYNE